MNLRLASVYFMALACAFAALAGCSREPADAGQPQVAQPSEPTHQQFGEFEIHYNAVRSDEIAPEVARVYSIERSANRVMLNVSLLHRDAQGRLQPVDGQVSVRVVNLNGQLKPLRLRRVTEGESVYFIGDVGIAGNEILVFDIDAAPAGATGKYTVQFKREFFAD